MAGKNRFNLAKELIEELKKTSTELSDSKLRIMIRMHLGSDKKRCVEPYIELMDETGLIKQVENGWKFN